MKTQNDYSSSSDDDLEYLSLSEALDVEPHRAASDADYERHLFRLGSVLDFIPDDLAYNRAGSLSPEQAKRLWLELRTQFWLVIGILSVVAFANGLIGVVLSGTLFSLIPMLICMGLAVAAAGLLGYTRNTLLDKPVDSTAVRIGRFALTFKRLGSNKAAFKLDNKHKLEANKGLYKVMRPNQDYVAYYVQPLPLIHTYQIVSMEPAGDLEAETPYDAPKAKRGLFPKRKRDF